MRSVRIIGCFLFFCSFVSYADWKVVATHPVFEIAVTEISIEPKGSFAFFSTDSSSAFVDLESGQRLLGLEAPGKGYFIQDGLYFVGTFKVSEKAGCIYRTQIFRSDDWSPLLEFPETMDCQVMPLLKDERIVICTVTGQVQVFDVNFENTSFTKVSEFEVTNLSSLGQSGIQQLYLSKGRRLIGVAYFDVDKVFEQDSMSARIFQIDGKEIAFGRDQTQLLNDDWSYRKSSNKFFAAAIDDLGNMVGEQLDENGDFVRFTESAVLPNQSLAITGHADGTIRVWRDLGENGNSK